MTMFSVKSVASPISVELDATTNNIQVSHPWFLYPICYHYPSPSVDWWDFINPKADELRVDVSLTHSSHWDSVMSTNNCQLSHHYIAAIIWAIRDQKISLSSLLFSTSSSTTATPIIWRLWLASVGITILTWHVWLGWVWDRWYRVLHWFYLSTTNHAWQWILCQVSKLKRHQALVHYFDHAHFLIHVVLLLTKLSPDTFYHMQESCLLLWVILKIGQGSHRWTFLRVELTVIHYCLSPLSQ